MREGISRALDLGGDGAEEERERKAGGIDLAAQAAVVKAAEYGVAVERNVERGEKAVVLGGAFGVAAGDGALADGGGGVDGLRRDGKLFVSVGGKAGVEGQLDGCTGLKVREAAERGVLLADALGDERVGVADAKLDVGRDDAERLSRTDV